MNPQDSKDTNVPNIEPKGSGETPAPAPPVMSTETHDLQKPEVPELEQKPFEPKVIPQQGGHKKYIKWSLIVLLLLIAASFGVWWFAMRENKKSTQTNSTSSSTTSETTTTATSTSDLVAYAFKDKSSPYSIYWRSAVGGNRTEVKKLSATDVVTYYDSSGSNTAFATTNSIYVSTDGGRTYKAVFVGEGGAQITSFKFSSEGKNIAFGLLPSLGKKNIVKSIDLDGKDQKDLFTSEMAGVFIKAYSVGKQKIIYQEGCFNCDGPPGDLLFRDLKTNKVTTLLTESTAVLSAAEVSNDLSTIIYHSADAIKFNLLNLANNKTTQIASAPNTTKSIALGFTANNLPYYAVDNQLYVVKNGKPSLVFKATDLILKTVYVSDKEVIIGTGKDTSDYSLGNYNIATQKLVKIFQGDNNTLIFGVTTK